MRGALELGHRAKRDKATRCREMRFLSFRTEGAAMKTTIAHVRRSNAGIKSILLTICLALAMVACERSPNRPMPPQSPPKPKAASNAPNAGNEHPGIYDASNVSSAVFKYSSPTEIQFQNAQGRTVKRLVIRT